MGIGETPLDQHAKNTVLEIQKISNFELKPMSMPKFIVVGPTVQAAGRGFSETEERNCREYIVVCQGGGVSSKTRRRGADKTLSLNPLVRSKKWTIMVCSYSYQSTMTLVILIDTLK